MANNPSRDPAKGTHSHGAPFAPGSPFTPRNKASQPEPAGNKVKTSASYQMTPKLPTVSPQSRQAQSQISAPPAPFKNPNAIANAPVGTASIEAAPGPVQKPASGLRNSKAPFHPNPAEAGSVRPSTLNKMVGYGKSPRKVGKITAGATKGGHSLLYGD